MKLLLLPLALALLAGAARAQSIDECLQQDSISCVQKSLFRKARDLFGKESLDLVPGVSLVRAKVDARASRSGNDLVFEQEIEKAQGVAERQAALENFVGEEVSQFLTGRSLKINFAPAFEKISESARAVSESIPTEVRKAVDEVVEGRGRKKMLKSLMPLILAAKVKLGALATLAYFGIALLAKKAILASIISIAISAFLGLKSLWSRQGGDITGYSAGYSASGGISGGWPAPAPSGGAWYSGGGGGGGGSGWDDGHASYAQSQAFSGYHR